MLRRIAPVALCLAAAVAGCGSSSTTSPSHTQTTATRAQELACLKSYIGSGSHVSQSPAAASVTRAFTALSGAKALPGTIPSTSVQASGVVSVDPSHAALLTHADSSDIYLIGADLRSFSIPASCSRVPGAAAFLAAQNLQIGNGPGACLVQIADRNVESVRCSALNVINSFQGGASIENADQSQLLLVPDGVQSLRFTLPNGSVRTAPVSHNLAHVASIGTAPQLSSFKNNIGAFTTALRTFVKTHYPTSMRRIDAAGNVTATYRQPAGLINQLTAALPFEIQLLGSASTGSSSGSATVTTNLYSTTTG